MKKHIWITTVVVVLGLFISSCRAIVNMSTKNWKKELVNIEKADYKVLINANLSTSCPKSLMMLNRDSIRFDNSFFPGVLKNLMNKTSSRMEFVNMKFQDNLKLDIYYYPKSNNELIANKDTLVNLLKNTLHFSIHTDSITSKVYSIKITDKTKLSSHIDNGGISRIILPKNAIEISGCTLNSIFENVENNVKIFIDYSLDDSTNYKMTIPKDNVDNLIAYLNKECGIEMIENERKVGITRIVFE